MVAGLVLTGLLVATSLSVLLGVLARRAGTDEAVRSFDRVAAVVAGSVVAPRATPELRQGDPQAQEGVRRVVVPLLDAGPVAHITIREPDGRVVWSDQPGLAGSTTGLTEAQRTALRTQSVVTDPGTTPPAAPPDHLTASVGVQDTTGSPLLVQVAERRENVAARTAMAWARFAPVSLAALAVLELVQVPVVWVLARRLRQRREAETALREAADEVAAVERRRIASEVHDHVIPDLTGVALSLDAARLGGPDAVSPTALLDSSSRSVRSAIGELRRLLVDLSRARLPDAGLATALTDLADRMALSGVHVELHTSGLEGVRGPAAELLYRCAQETLRNVATHSRAAEVELSAVRAGDEVTLTIDDDGCGFDEARLAESSRSGHLGLRALGGLIADAGGSLAASSAPGQGTRVLATVPVPAGSEFLPVPR